MSLYLKTIPVWLYRDADSNANLAEQLEMDEEATTKFLKCCHFGIELTVTVMTDGTAYATHVNRVPLREPIEVTK